jgi:predicted dehydrogenase/threonine dehydrogenase-like Zn-dependent dehydrogenase
MAAMKQLFLNASQIAVIADAPAPTPGPREILVRTVASAVSPGTETAGYGAGSPVARGVTDPSVLRRVGKMVAETGFSQTIKTIEAKLASLTPRGYSGAGVVVAVGSDVAGYREGDRVAFMGAPHAQFVAVRERLVARIPDGVAYEEAAFGALACIALHGVRLGGATVGECVVVAGLGILGQLAAQFSRLGGATVVAADPAEVRADAARALGIPLVLSDLSDGLVARMVDDVTARRGADVLLLCASTKNRDAVNGYLNCCRDQARVVVIGDVSLDLDRGPLFRRELSLRVSRSYGPGRYDPAYEEAGHDYPAGFVRWTEQRNLEFYLQALREGNISVRALITDTVPFAEAPSVYNALASGSAEKLGVVLAYDADFPVDASTAPVATSALIQRSRAKTGAAGMPVRLGVIGAGAFARSNLLPHCGPLGARVSAIANRTGVAFAELRSLYSPEVLTTNPAEVLNRADLDAVIIATQHDSHADLALRALARGLAVHVEKPMSLTLLDAERIRDAVVQYGGLLTIGYNRRFSVLTDELRDAVATSGPGRQYLYRINAPPPPPGHWTIHPRIGGGRLVGEGCHFIDLVRYLAQSEVESVDYAEVDAPLDSGLRGDSWSLTMRFSNGDIGTIVYSGRGSVQLPKERLEVFAGGWSAVLDNFLALRFFGRSGGRVLRTSDKGFRAQLKNFLGALRGAESLRTDVSDGLAVARIIELAKERRRPDDLMEDPA